MTEQLRKNTSACKNVAMDDWHTTVSHLKNHRVEFFLAPNMWQKYPHYAELKWTVVEFSEDSRPEIPEETGVYLFLVRPPEIDIPNHGYVMYAGKAGDRSKNNLRKRFQQYFREKRSRKRPHVHLLLTQWEKSLLFCYATIDVAHIDVGKLESELLDALQPPYSKQGFSASVGEARRGIV